MIRHAASFAQRANPVHFLCSTDENGDQCYFFLRATEGAYRRLMLQKQKTYLDLSAYGQVLASGYGTTPSATVLEALKREHGLDYSGEF